MNHLLLQALERVGWNEIYEQHIPDLRQANSSGERTGNCPFPDTIDTNRSLSVNVNTGLWNCFQSHRGGNYVRFRAILDSTELDPVTGHMVENLAETERRLMAEFRVTPPVTEQWVAERAEALARDPALLHRLQQIKPWELDTCRQLGVGYDAQSNRLTLPVRDQRGQLVNAKLYRPGAQPKMIWLIPGAEGTSGSLWPSSAWHEEALFLVEGEPDVISLRSHGVMACSSVAGSAIPVPPGGWERGKSVAIWLDQDQAGQRATEVAIQQLVGSAREVRLVRPPQWEGMPGSADASDYLLHLRAQGLTREEVTQELQRLWVEAEVLDSPLRRELEPAEPISFQQLGQGGLVGRRVEVAAKVVARTESRFALPIQFTLTCPAQGYQFCNRCGLRTNQGRINGAVRPTEQWSLGLYQASESEQITALKRQFRIPMACPEPQMQAHAYEHIEGLMVQATEPEAVDASRWEVLVAGDPGLRPQEATDYRLAGFVYPAPKNQSLVMVVDQVQPPADQDEDLELTPELVSQLDEAFGARGNPLAALRRVAQDLSASTTYIYGREDLHLLYRTVWHSVLAFDLGGIRVERGWLQAIVVGDTRCGKSQTFQRLSHLYGVGTLVDCKNQTLPGLLGTVVTAQATGYRYVVPGLLPLHDGKVVCFDEFHHGRDDMGGGLLARLASTRSEGRVRLTKAASATFLARVRSIWLCNPGNGKRLLDQGQTAVDRLPHLIPQPEDIARFDVGMAVGERDVPAAVLNQAPTPAQPQVEPRLHRALLRWAWQLTPEQVVFTAGALATVLQVAQRQVEAYDTSVPLVEPAEQRNRVAKLSVSVAAQVFSHDRQRRLVVDEAHVLAAEHLFQLWYDKPVMGYRAHSEGARGRQGLVDEAEVRRAFEELAGRYGPQLAQQLLYLEEISERSFRTLIPGSGHAAQSILQLLHVNRGLQLVRRGRRDSFEVTTDLKEWISRWLTSLP